MARKNSPSASFIATATGKRAVTKSAKAKALEADLAKDDTSLLVLYVSPDELGCSNKTASSLRHVL
jgi:hypothetical protein